MHTVNVYVFYLWGEGVLVCRLLVLRVAADLGSAGALRHWQQWQQSLQGTQVQKQTLLRQRSYTHTQAISDIKQHLSSDFSRTHYTTSISFPLSLTQSHTNTHTRINNRALPRLVSPTESTKYRSQGACACMVAEETTVARREARKGWNGKANRGSDSAGMKKWNTCSVNGTEMNSSVKAENTYCLKEERREERKMRHKNSRKWKGRERKRKATKRSWDLCIKNSTVFYVTMTFQFTSAQIRGIILRTETSQRR